MEIPGPGDIMKNPYTLWEKTGIFTQKYGLLQSPTWEKNPWITHRTTAIILCYLSTIAAAVADVLGFVMILFLSFCPLNIASCLRTVDPGTIDTEAEKGYLKRQFF